MIVNPVVFVTWRALVKMGQPSQADTLDAHPCLFACVELNFCLNFLSFNCSVAAKVNLFLCWLEDISGFVFTISLIICHWSLVEVSYKALKFLLLFLQGATNQKLVHDLLDTATKRCHKTPLSWCQCVIPVLLPLFSLLEKRSCFGVSYRSVIY